MRLERSALHHLRLELTSRRPSARRTPRMSASRSTSLRESRRHADAAPPRGRGALYTLKSERGWQRRASSPLSTVHDSCAHTSGGKTPSASDGRASHGRARATRRRARAERRARVRRVRAPSSRRREGEGGAIEASRSRPVRRSERVRSSLARSRCVTRGERHGRGACGAERRARAVEVAARVGKGGISRELGARFERANGGNVVARARTRG